MRPQFQGRASRATVALCATTLAAGAAAPAAGTSTTAMTTTPGPDAHIAVAAAAPRPRAHRRRRRRRRLAPRLEAVMLHRDLLAGGDIAFVGSTAPALSRHAIHVQAWLGRRWIDVAGTRTTGHGHFIARYWPRALGALRMRLRIAGAGDRAATLVEPTATVFHEAVVSWYDGPGGTTACGETLEPGTLGVANLTLPCGTPVTLRYGGHTITVPVIDRGPYVAGREFDLTYATKAALGAGGITVVWASA